MKTKRSLLIVCTLISLLAVQVFAGNRSGTVTAQFLKLPINARAAGMGNAQVALAEGASSIPFNPAGTLSTESMSFGATYNQWWADITHSFVGAAVNLQELGTVGAGVMMLSTDDMLVRTPAFPEGTGEKFKAFEAAYMISYSRQISQDFGIGLSAKYIQSNLYNKEIKANSFAFDIGTLYDVDILRTRLGISVNNLGKDLTYINETYSLPTALRFGARTSVLEDENNKLYLAFQIARPNDADEQYNLGAEYILFETVSVRSGYRFNYDAENFSAGVGVNLASVGLQGMIDYAFTNYTTLPATHMFSIEIGF